MPKVVEMLLEIALAATVMILLIAIISIALKEGGYIDTSIKDVMDQIFANITRTITSTGK